MDGRRNNKGTKGNKGGRPPTKRDYVWHQGKWEVDSNVEQLQAKLKTGKYSVRDVFLAKALQGNERILGIFADKLLAALVDLRGKDGQDLPLVEAVSAELQASISQAIRYAIPNATPNLKARRSHKKGVK